MEGICQFMWSIMAKSRCLEHSAAFRGLQLFTSLNGQVYSFSLSLYNAVMFERPIIFKENLICTYAHPSSINNIVRGGKWCWAHDDEDMHQTVQYPFQPFWMSCSFQSGGHMTLCLSTPESVWDFNTIGWAFKCIKRNSDWDTSKWSQPYAYKHWV